MQLRYALVAGLLLSLTGSFAERAEEQSPTDAEKKNLIDAALRSIGRHPDADRALELEKKGEYSAALKLLEDLPDSAFSEPARYVIRSIDAQGGGELEYMRAIPNLDERRLAIIRCRRALSKPADVDVKLAWELIAEKCTDPLVRLCIAEDAEKTGTLDDAANRLRVIFKKNEDKMASGMALTYVEAVQQMNDGKFENPLALIRRGASNRSGETSYYRDLKEQVCQALARHSMEVVPHLIRELDSNGQPTWIVYCLGLWGACQGLRAS